MTNAPISSAGRVRKWLDTVPAARVWAVPHRLLLPVGSSPGVYGYIFMPPAAMLADAGLVEE